MGLSDSQRSWGRIIAAFTGVVLVVTVAVWLLGTPADEYILLPDDPHPADAVVSVGGAKPTPSRDGSGIYYLDVLVHRASLPESWLSPFEDGGTVVPAEAIVPPGGNQSDLDRIDRLDFADSRTVAGVVALRALGRKVTVSPHRRHVRRRRHPSPAYNAGLRPGMIITTIDGVAVPGVDDLRTQMKGRKPGSPIRLTVRDGRARASSARG